MTEHDPAVPPPGGAATPPRDGTAPADRPDTAPTDRPDDFAADPSVADADPAAPAPEEPPRTTDEPPTVAAPGGATAADAMAADPAAAGATAAGPTAADPTAAGTTAADPTAAGATAAGATAAGATAAGATAAGATAAGATAVGGGGWVPPGGGWGSFAGRRLTRSSQRKVLAGVAGGLGEYTGVDPVLFRVLFAVLTLFGGSGILLYIVGWLFLPSDDQQVSPAESLIHRGTGGSGTRARDAAAAGALIVAGLVLAGVLALGDARDLALVLVVVGGAVFLVRNLPERRAGGPPQPVDPGPPPAPYEAVLPTYQPPPAYQPPATYPQQLPTYPPQPTGSLPTYPPPGYEPVAAPTGTLPPPPLPAPPPPRREHSILGVLTLSVLLVALGVAAALDAAGAITPEPDDLLAVAVGTLGAGLIVGAWFGRARWLTWLAIPLLAALVVVSASNVSLKGGVGDRRYAPQQAAEIQPEYRIGVGNLRLDLTDVDLSNRLVRSKLSAGVGAIEVIVPRNADVSVQGRSGVGEVDLFGHVESGTSSTRSVVDYGPTGDGTIDLTLDLDVSIGRVEVDRAAA